MTKNHIHGGDVYRYPNVVDFSANCNPFGMPKGVKEAAAMALEQAEHYPDVECSRLREALEQAEGVSCREIICGNGAADLIFGLVLAKKPKKALLLAPTFAEYEQALAAAGCTTEYYFLKEETGFVPDKEFFDRITAETDMVFFCNPNNPTGVLKDRAYIRRLAEKCKSCGAFLVLDECFVDFLEQPGEYTMKPYLEEYPGMFLLKAFTKKYAMAGLRLGYGFCSDLGVLEQMKAVMQPWNVSVIAQAAGEAALLESEYAEKTLKKLREEREFLFHALAKTELVLYGSQANYIFFKGPEGMREQGLKQGISIRDCSNYTGLGKGYYRIAVRLRKDNEKLLQVFETILQAEKRGT